jgi:hypothetical protein
MSPSLQLFIAQEERALGQTIEALRDARACARDFEADPTLSHRDEFMASCRAIADELSASMGRLTVRVPADAPTDLRVVVRGEPLGRSAWNTELELVPGTAMVEASAEGREPFSRSVVLGAGGASMVHVELAPLAATRRARVEAPPSSGVGAGPWVLVGGGVAALVLAGVFVALHRDAVDERDARCRTPVGDCVVPNAAVAVEANELQERASTYNTVAMVSVGVGVAATVGGVLWSLVGGRTRRSAPMLSLSHTGTVEFGLRGSW